MPTLVLALNYWLHLIATVVWIGGLAIFVLVAWPGLRRTLGSDPRLTEVLDVLEQRFRPLANISLLVLIVTGLLQMGGDPNYEGLLAFTNAWSVTLLVKHILIGGMIGVGALLQLSIQPALKRQALLVGRGAADPAQEAIYRRRQQRLTVLNLALGMLILLFTAILTAL